MAFEKCTLSTMSFRTLICLVSLVVFPLIVGCSGSRRAATLPSQSRAEALRHTRATYCSAPRKPDGRVDVERLIAELTDLHANTYSFCIHSSSNDWEDLH